MLTVGDGRDGALNVTAGTYDAQANGDMIAHSVSAISGATISVDATNGLAVGDAVLLINLSGPIGATDYVGNHEARWVDSVGAGTITLDLPPSTPLGPGGDISDQEIWLQRIPQYTSVTTTGGVLTATGRRDGGTGILAFRSTGLVDLDNSIVMTGKGWLGNGPASNGIHGRTGESLSPVPDQGTNPGQPNLGGGGGGASDCNVYSCTTQLTGAGGGGASYLTSGVSGADNGGLHTGGSPGLVYGDSCHTKLLLGSGGGGGAGGVSGPGVVNLGGDGGGIIHIVAPTVDIDAYIPNRGDNGSNNNNCGSQGSGGGGGGSGGSTIIYAETLTALPSTLLNYGGLGACNGGGDGGYGRVMLRFTTLNGLPVTGDTSAERDAVADPAGHCVGGFSVP